MMQLGLSPRHLQPLARIRYWKREEARKGVEWGLQKDGLQRPRPGFRALRDVSGHEMTEVNTVTFHYL